MTYSVVCMELRGRHCSTGYHAARYSKQDGGSRRRIAAAALVAIFVFDASACVAASPPQAESISRSSGASLLRKESGPSGSLELPANQTHATRLDRESLPFGSLAAINGSGSSSQTALGPRGEAHPSNASAGDDLAERAAAPTVTESMSSEGEGKSETVPSVSAMAPPKAAALSRQLNMNSSQENSSLQSPDPQNPIPSGAAAMEPERGMAAAASPKAAPLGNTNATSTAAANAETHPAPGAVGHGPDSRSQAINDADMLAALAPPVVSNTPSDQPDTVLREVRPHSQQQSEDNGKRERSEDQASANDVDDNDDPSARSQERHRTSSQRHHGRAALRSGKGRVARASDDDEVFGSTGLEDDGAPDSGVDRSQTENIQRKPPVGSISRVQGGVVEDLYRSGVDHTSDAAHLDDQKGDSQSEKETVMRRIAAEEAALATRHVVQETVQALQASVIAETAKLAAREAVAEAMKKILGKPDDDLAHAWESLNDSSATSTKGASTPSTIAESHKLDDDLRREGGSSTSDIVDQEGGVISMDGSKNDATVDARVDTTSDATHESTSESQSSSGHVNVTNNDADDSVCPTALTSPSWSTCSSAEALVGGTPDPCFKIPDSKITASSTSLMSSPDMQRSRMHAGTSGWETMGDTQNASEWIQWDFGRMVQISRLATRGVKRSSTDDGVWVTSYRLEYSTDGVRFSEYTAGLNHQHSFVGNINAQDEVHNDINPPVVARVLRFVPLAWEANIGLRAEVYGCTANAEAQSFANVSTGAVNTIPTHTVMVVESSLFAQELINDERAKLCGDKAPITFNVARATVQVTQGVLVSMVVEFPDFYDPPTLANVIVEWLPNGKHETPMIASALARVQAMLEANGTMVGLMDNSAKLILPMSACNITVAAANQGTDSLLQRGRPRPKLGQDDGHREPAYGFGLLVEKEMSTYKAGLTTDGGAKNQTIPKAVFPAKFDWRAQSPLCLDYVHEQNDCGSSYMFAAIDSISDRHCINSLTANPSSTLRHDEHLSIMQGLVCEPNGRQCSGGFAQTAFEIARDMGLQTHKSWGYERSCLSDSVCDVGGACYSTATTQCANFFGSSELETIDTFADALSVVRAKCADAHINDPDACRSWAAKRFHDASFGLATAFNPATKYCDDLKAEFEMHVNGTGNSTRSNASALDQSMSDVPMRKHTPPTLTMRASAVKPLQREQHNKTGAVEGNDTEAKVQNARMVSPDASNLEVARRLLGIHKSALIEQRSEEHQLSDSARGVAVEGANHSKWFGFTSFTATNMFARRRRTAESISSGASLNATASGLPKITVNFELSNVNFNLMTESQKDDVRAAVESNFAEGSQTDAEHINVELLPGVGSTVVLVEITCRAGIAQSNGIQALLQGPVGTTALTKLVLDVGGVSGLDTTRIGEVAITTPEFTVDVPEALGEISTPRPAAQEHKKDMAAVCDPNRCSAEPHPHKVTSFHYIWNTKDAFKQELYSEGPFYTSFYVYEDFPWFFRYFPTHGYARSWGIMMLGGHSSVLVGWNNDCVVHNTPVSPLLENIATQGSAVEQSTQLHSDSGANQRAQRAFEEGEDEEDQLLQLNAPSLLELTPDSHYVHVHGKRRKVRRKHDRTQRHRAARKMHQPSDESPGWRPAGTAIGECWLLRNTWGDRWADEGYFRVAESQLTGPEGTHLHIASAAADGPLSAVATSAKTTSATPSPSPSPKATSTSSTTTKTITTTAASR